MIADMLWLSKIDKPSARIIKKATLNGSERFFAILFN